MTDPREPETVRRIREDYARRLREEGYNQVTQEQFKENMRLSAQQQRALIDPMIDHSITQEEHDAQLAALLDKVIADLGVKITTIVSSAIFVERQRWNPAVTYFERYCVDEADSAENCTCGEAQHEAAKAFEAVIRIR